MRSWTGMLALALMGAPAAAQPAKPAAPRVILHQNVPLYDVYAWERWGNFINAQAGSKTEIPYDAARLQVKVYTYPTGEIRAIRFNNAVRTHRHINQTDTILYGWQAHRVQFVNNQAVVAGPGDFALHQKGVDHSGEEIRRGGGIDLEFAMTIPGRHNDPAGYWSLARDNPVQPAASWPSGRGFAEAVGSAALAAAPPGAVRYQVREARLPGYTAREIHLKAGTTLPSLDPARDRLMFLLSGTLDVEVGGERHRLVSEDTARAVAGAPFMIVALEDSVLVQASVPPLKPAK
jgi:quercetin dioxygenase-like cupin family protein